MHVVSSVLHLLLMHLFCPKPFKSLMQSAKYQLRSTPHLEQIDDSLFSSTKTPCFRVPFCCWRCVWNTSYTIQLRVPPSWHSMCQGTQTVLACQNLVCCSLSLLLPDRTIALLRTKIAGPPRISQQQTLPRASQRPNLISTWSPDLQA